MSTLAQNCLSDQPPKRVDRSESGLGFEGARREVDISEVGAPGSSGEEVLSAWHRTEGTEGAQKALLDGREAEWINEWRHRWMIDG